MGELYQIHEVLQLNPYVKQISKLAKSLSCLSETFAREEVEKGKDLGQAVEEIALHIKNNYDKSTLEGEEHPLKTVSQWKEIVFQIMADIDEYGAELSVNKKRELEKQCNNFKEINQYIQNELARLKQKQILNERLYESKQASLLALNAYARAVEENAKELDRSIFKDERLEKRINLGLKRYGVRTLKVVLLVSSTGKYEVQVSAKAKAGVCITTKQIGEVISNIMGKELVPEIKERLVLKEEYTTLYYIEKPEFYLLHGMAKVAKVGSEVSGDNFLVMDLDSGKKGLVLSDGMGSGVGAYEVSKMILEMSETLLEAGVSPLLAVEMINALMVSKEDEVKFGTFDLSLLDLYNGQLELVKSGASITFVAGEDGVKEFGASSLPLGVVGVMQPNCYNYKIGKETLIIMMTDGVSELIKEKNKVDFIESILKEVKTRNPKELAQIILDKVLKDQNDIAIDDMMVLVIGAWSTK